MTAIPNTAPLHQPVAPQHLPHALGALLMSDGSEYEVSIIYRNSKGEIIDLSPDHNLCLFDQDPSSKELVKTRLKMIAEAHAKAKNKEFKDITRISIKDEGVAFDNDAITSHDLSIDKTFNDTHKTTYTKVASIWDEAKEKLVEDYQHHQMHANDASVTMPVQLTVGKATPEAELTKANPATPVPQNGVPPKQEGAMPANPPKEEPTDPRLLPNARDLSKAVNAAASKKADTAQANPTAAQANLPEEDDDDAEQAKTPAAPQAPGYLSQASNFVTNTASSALSTAKAWTSRPLPTEYVFTGEETQLDLDDVQERFQALVTKTKHKIPSPDGKKTIKGTIVEHFFRLFDTVGKGYDGYFEEANPFHNPAIIIRNNLQEMIQGKEPAQVIQIFAALKADVRTYPDRANNSNFVEFMTYIIETELEQYIKGYLFVDATSTQGKEKDQISLRKLHKLLQLSTESDLLNALELPNLSTFLNSLDAKGACNLHNTPIYHDFIEPVIGMIRDKRGEPVRSATNNWKKYLTKI